MSTLKKRDTLSSNLLIGLFLILITIVAFWQVKNHNFINFDDHLYISENPYVTQGLTWKSIKWALTADLLTDSVHADFWIPITYLSHIVTAQVFGMDPSGHHLVNLGFHLLNVLLLFLVLQQMTHARWPSAFVATLFAIHPLHVESVAWVTERKDVLSAFFWILTMGAYLRYTKKPGLHRYLLVILLLILGLMSKPMVVTLPFVLLLLDFWPIRRITFSDGNIKRNLKKIWNFIFEKLPLFILIIGFSATTFFSMYRVGSVDSLELIPFWSRIHNMLLSYAGYMGKIIYPKNLAIFYPHSNEPLSILQITGAGLLLLSIFILVIVRIRESPYLATGWFWYLGTLVPVIGLVQAGGQSMADRYTYIPMIGLAIMVSWGVPELFGRWPHNKPFLVLVASFIILSLSFRT